MNIAWDNLVSVHISMFSMFKMDEVNLSSALVPRMKYGRSLNYCYLEQTEVNFVSGVSLHCCSFVNAYCCENLG